MYSKEVVWRLSRRAEAFPLKVDITAASTMVSEYDSVHRRGVDLSNVT